MAQSVQGVIAREKGAPVEIATIVVPDRGPGEALVQIQACGVCHTDLHYRQGGIGDDFPYFLGHEAAGVVEAVGDDVTDVAPGDFVILNWRAVCGQCRACLRGRPWYCFNTHNAQQKMTLEDGTVLSAALGIGAFAEKTLVASGQCTKVNPAARPEVAVVAPCGFHLDDAATQAGQVARQLPGIPVWAIDADGLVVRPGPRLVDGVEALAAILHPEVAVAPPPGRIRRIA